MVTFLLERIAGAHDSTGRGHSKEIPADRRSRIRATDSEANGAVERRAIEVATAHLHARGFDVTDVGVPGFPYDLCATREGEELHVEVKGRIRVTETVDLTHREVDAAMNYPHSALAVVDGIVLNRSNDGVSASGGRLRIWHNWLPSETDLTPTTYQYQLPPA